MFDKMKQLAEKKHEGQFRNVRKGGSRCPLYQTSRKRCKESAGLG